MKIIILQEHLREALQACSKAVATSSSLPILNSVFLKTNNGLLEVTGTNLEMSISHTVRCKVEEDGEVCVQAKALSELVSSLPNEALTMALEGSSLTLKNKSFDTKLNTYDPSDFPKISVEKAGESFGVVAEEFSRGITGALFAVSGNETQAELCGVYLFLEGESLTCVGTDRYRLGEKTLKVKNVQNIKPVGFILPARSGSEIARVCELAGGELATVVVEEGRVVVSVGSTKISSRLIDGKYPDYKAIIPEKFEVDVVVEKKEFLSALKAVGVFARGGEGLEFLYSQAEGKVVLSASTSEAGSGKVEVEASVIPAGVQDKVLFNYKYLQDVFNYLTEGEIVIKLNSSQSPVVVRVKNEESYTYLVMPIKK